MQATSPSAIPETLIKVHINIHKIKYYTTILLLATLITIFKNKFLKRRLSGLHPLCFVITHLNNNNSGMITLRTTHASFLNLGNGLS